MFVCLFCLIVSERPYKKVINNSLEEFVCVCVWKLHIVS